MNTRGERLRFLRVRAGYKSARDALIVIETPISTYNSHERAGQPGGRDFDEDYAARYARAFGGDMIWLFHGKGEPGDIKIPPVESAPGRASRRDISPNISPPFAAPHISERKIPVYGVAVGGDDGRMKFNGERLDMVGCPPQLMNAVDAYAVYVSGESMVPSFKPGQTAWVNPNITARNGDDVILQLHAEDGEAPEGFIKELVKRTPSQVIVRQFNPPMEIAFNLKEVRSIHKVVFASRD